MNTTKVCISELANLVSGKWSGDEDVVLTGLNDIHSAGEGQISFVVDKKMIPTEINASALIVPDGMDEVGVPVIQVENPLLAATMIHRFFIGEVFSARGVSDHAYIGEGCIIDEEVTIAPMAVVGNNVTIGAGVTISSGVVVADDVVIGDGTYLYPNVSILAGSVLGKRVVIHSGTVIGSDGFGYVYDGKGTHIKRPHVGFVQIDDDVEIGANSCVDRATFGKTWIKRGTKIDNQVQIAHNVEVGESSILVAQSGISGSTRVGNGLVMGGKSALSGHLDIGDQVTIAAKTGVTSNVESGQVVAGFPAIPHRKWLRASTSFVKLPDLIREVRELKNRLASFNNERQDE